MLDQRFGIETLKLDGGFELDRKNPAQAPPPFDMRTFRETECSKEAVVAFSAPECRGRHRERLSRRRELPIRQCPVQLQSVSRSLPCLNRWRNKAARSRRRHPSALQSRRFHSGPRPTACGRLYPLKSRRGVVGVPGIGMTAASVTGRGLRPPVSPRSACHDQR